VALADRCLAGLRLLGDRDRDREDAVVARGRKPECIAINSRLAGAGQEGANPTANRGGVDAHDRLLDRVTREQDDVLCTLPLVSHDGALTDHLWGQLVDLLVESQFLDLRRDLVEGRVDRETYVAELTALADSCRAVGLLPLPTR
jgi:hypothetical protein